MIYLLSVVSHFGGVDEPETCLGGTHGAIITGHLLDPAGKPEPNARSSKPEAEGGPKSRSPI